LTPKTKKSIGARMGKGVGNFYKNICNVKEGDIILEIYTNLMMTNQLIKNVLLEASKKLSIPTKLYKKIV
jgi:ribosomal protein L16/L10AE